jgi:uncharacterized repeat protein (TIGR03803 family)
MKRVVDALLVLYGAAALHAQTFTTLHSFYGADGESPFGGLVQATDGNFYGTTAAGESPVVGTIFKITPNGTLTTVYSFCSQSGCPDGDWPNVGLLQATDGNFYGTAYHGGATGDFGTVFKMTPGGTLTTLHTFCSRSGCTDGRYPEAVLVQGADGFLYGTTRRGGTHDCGTVFKMTTSGKLTTLYSFGSQAALMDGASPHAGLVQATNGDFYGTTTRGGAKQFGTVFKISPSGALTTLYSFCSQSGCQDGGGPVAGLVQGVNEDLYGTTLGGGANGFGTVFEITQSGSLATLHSFCSQSGCPDGGAPHAGLVRAIDGNFYGTTAGAGTNIGGTIFKITPNGTLTTLYSFCPPRRLCGRCEPLREPHRGHQRGLLRDHAVCVRRPHLLSILWHDL